MALSFVQTDTAAADGEQTACSSGTLADGSAASCQMEQNGTAGSTEQTVKNSAGVTGVAGFGCQSPTGGVGESTWESGDWTVPVDASTGNTTVTLQEIHICEWLPGGSSGGTVASLTGIGQAMSAGVHTFTVTQGSDYTPSGTDSEIYIVFVFDFGGSHGNEQFGLTPSQTVDSPITTGGGAPPGRGRHYRRGLQQQIMG